MHVVVYTRPGCHLCDDAIGLLESYQLRPQCVNIDEDPQLLTLYNTCVPVVEIDGNVRFRGRIDRILLERLIAHSPPRSSTSDAGK